MKRVFHPIEFFILVVAIGLVATFSAPWYEMRGSYAAWHIDEWHTFWRGANAFMLDSVVSSNVVIPIEYATTAMQAMLQNWFVVGGILGMWHSIVLALLLFLSGRMRLYAGVSRVRVVFEIGMLVVTVVAMLGALAWLFTLPSSLATKVDFRTVLDVHTDSLVWSSIDIVFIVPGLSIVAALTQILLAIRLLTTNH